MSTLSRRSKRTPFRKNVLNEISRKGNLNRTTTVQDCTKFPSSLTNVLLQLVRDVINIICYQRYKNRLEQQKGRPNVNVCTAEQNLEEKL